MDGFDDLLSPSRNTLEDNPFANPFAQPHHSESNDDPWASPFGQQEDDIYSQPFASPPPTSTHDDNAHGSHEENGFAEDDDEGTTPIAEEPDADPLDSAAANIPDPEEEERPALPRQRSSTTDVPTVKSEVILSPSTPGFRESLPSPEHEPEPTRKSDPLPAPFSETATIRPSEPEETIPAHSATASVEKPVEHGWDGPLHTNGHGFDHNFGPGLSIGGEAVNEGWGGPSEPEVWSNDRAGSRFPTETEADEDPDDDTPIGILQKARSQSKEEHPVFTISVDDPQKVGDPIRGYTMYTVHTRTTSTLYAKSSFSVLRRYSDFLWLYETLNINNPGVVVPPVPEKNPFGRFDDSFVKQRRQGLEKCIQKIANHPILGKDEDLKAFLESDTFSLDIKHRKNEGGGLMASIGQSLTGPKFIETDEWFDRQKGYLDSLESQLRGLVKAIDVVARQRQQIAAATGEFAQMVEDLASSDVGHQLAQSLSGLAEVERKAQDLQLKQTEQDMSTIMATVDEYARLINSVRMAFSSRIRTYHSWRNAESELTRVRQNHERNRNQGRIPTDRMSYALHQVAEAERRALESKREFENTSKLTKSEVARFEEERVADMKESLNIFLEGMISRQKQLISGWENYQQMLLKRVGSTTRTEGEY